MTDITAASYVSTRPVNIDPGSNESLEQAKNWLQDCKTHRDCTKPERGFMPTRLVQLSKKDGKIVLRLDPSSQIQS
jgi:hypothetical protein